MSKSAASAATPGFRRARRLRRALGALALLPTVVLAAPQPGPALRAAERIDLRRLGSVGDDERALLRVEWRAGQSAADEARAVGEMLDSLRRMEGTVVELGRLVRAMPVRGAALPAAPPPPEEPAGGMAWLTAGGAAAFAALAAALVTAVALRRRRAQEAADVAPPRTAAPNTGARRAAPSAFATPASAPLAGPVAESFLEPVAEPSARHAADPAAAAPAAADTPKSAAGTPGASAREAGAADADCLPAGPDAGGDLAAGAVPPAPTLAAGVTDLGAPGPVTIDFSLEEEEPEVVARANARVPVLRKRVPSPHTPERRQELNIEPTLQLAEIMLSMGLQQGAAQALVEYAEANPRQAVYHWLKLLAIYREAGQHEDFAQTAAKLRQHFNIRASEFGAAGPAEATGLEAFPRIGNHVQELWSRPAECIGYLRHLLEDNRDGSRTGFPQAVAEDILLLTEILKETSGAAQAEAGAATS